MQVQQCERGRRVFDAQILRLLQHIRAAGRGHGGQQQRYREASDSGTAGSNCHFLFLKCGLHANNARSVPWVTGYRDGAHLWRRVPEKIRPAVDCHDNLPEKPHLMYYSALATPAVARSVTHNLRLFRLKRAPRTVVQRFLESFGRPGIRDPVGESGHVELNPARD